MLGTYWTVLWCVGRDRRRVRNERGLLDSNHRKVWRELFVPVVIDLGPARTLPLTFTSKPQPQRIREEKTTSNPVLMTEPVAAAAPSSLSAPGLSSNGPSTSSGPRRRPRNRGPRGDNSGQNNQAPGSQSQPNPPSSATPRGQPRRQPAQPTQDRADVSASTSGASRPPRRGRGGGSSIPSRNPPSVTEGTPQLPGGSAQVTSDSSPTKPQRSRRQFGSQLTSTNTNTNTRRTNRPAATPAPNLDDLDLTSRLIYSFTHKEDGLDCPICFNSIHPGQPIWSCSPSEETETSCWKSFHLKCVRAWALKSR